jgi:dimethylaniline monooxygenase (N-oxide forming)
MTNARGEKVGIIGAGPAGLVCAKHLEQYGFDPVVFEQSDGVGGQWNAGAPHSSVWPSMCANTSRILTCFSDLDYPSGTPVFPANRDVLAYLRQYAERFEVFPRVRTRTTVESVGRHREGWRLRVRYDGGCDEEVFTRLIIACGRYSKPATPTVPGLQSFSGKLGAAHSSRYKNPERYRNARVLVAGCSISALEIASDLVMAGAARVFTSTRRQRYIFAKLLRGVPTDNVAFTRFAALAAESLPRETVARALKELMVTTSGSPEQYGAPKPAEDILAAGFSQSQHYLPFVAEGRITPKPWIESIEGARIRFLDGTEQEFDGIVFGTGFELDLPFLAPEIRAAIKADSRHMDLYRYTLHPDLPNLAFAGFCPQVGPHLPVLELQARWIAYAWSGARQLPSIAELQAGVAETHIRRGGPPEIPMHAAALMFAREAGVEPVLDCWPDLRANLLFGPLTPASFRLSGCDASAAAPARVIADGKTFGAVLEPSLSAEQQQKLRLLAAA